MHFSDTTQSFTLIGERSTQGINDRYARCGANVMVRKFDESVVPSGSWTEIWIGFRWRISSSINWATSSQGGTVINPMTEYIVNEFGLCNTNGPVWGQSASISDFSQQHSVGFIVSDHGSSGTAYWELRQSSSYVMASAGGYTKYRRAGVESDYNTGTLPIRQMSLFTNTAFFTASYRSLMVMRCYLDGVGSTPDGMRFSYIYPSTYAGVVTPAASIDFSSSVVLADIMGASNWTNATVSASAFNYTNYDAAIVVPVSQSTYGYFNGIFFSWKRLFDNLEISDIVIRKIP